MTAHPLTVTDVIHLRDDKVVSITADRSIPEAAAMLSQHQIGFLIVYIDGRFAGVLSERDLVRGTATQADDLSQLNVSDLMTTEVITVGPECEIRQAIDVMRSSNFRHLPVLDGRHVTGVVSLTDLTRALLLRAEFDHVTLSKLQEIGVF